MSEERQSSSSRREPALPTTVRIQTLRDTTVREESCSLGEELVFLKDSFGDIFQPLDQPNEGATALDANVRRQVLLRKCGQEENVSQFLKEVRLNALLEHPNIRMTYDLGVDQDGSLLAAMQYRNGSPLSEWFDMEANTIDLNRAFSIWESLCQAVSFAHSRNVAHTDVSENNAVIGEYGDVMLTDWNDAVHLDDGNRLTHVRADIAALGKLLERILVRQGDGTIHPSLQSVIASSGQSRRFYVSVDQLSGDVKRFRDGFPTKAENASLWREIVLFAKRKKKTFLFFALTVLTLAASGLTYSRILIHTTKKLEQTKEDLVDEQAKAREAATQAEKTLKERKSLAPAFVQLAKHYIDQEEYETALLNLERAAKMDPNLPGIYKTRGDLYQGQLKLDTAVSEYRVAQSLDPRDLNLIVLTNVTDRVRQSTIDDTAKRKLLDTMLTYGRYFEALRLANTISPRPGSYVEICNAVFSSLGLNCTCSQGEHGLEITPMVGNLDASKVMKTIIELEIRDVERINLTDGGNLYSAEELGKLPLKHLVASHTELHNLSGLAGGNLETLHLNFSRIHFLNDLEGMPLEELKLVNCRISDLYPLRNTPLQHLAANYTDVRDLYPIRNLFRHETIPGDLMLRGTKVFDLAPLRGMNLDYLQLYDTRVYDISPLETTRIRRLDVGSTSVSNLYPIRNHKDLWYLSLNGCKDLSDLQPLANLPNLKVLKIIGAQVSDLTALAKAPALATLRMNGTKVSDLSPLKNVATLNEVSFDSTKVTDLTPLKGLEGLRTLSLQNTDVTDLTPLANLKLATIRLSPSKISKGMDVLRDMTSLERIYTAKQSWLSPADFFREWDNNSKRTNGN